MNKKVGFIGLGEMGLAISKKLVDEEYKVIANDVDEETLNKAEDYGMKAVASPKEVAEEVDSVLFVMVATPDQIEEVLFDEEGVTQAETKKLNIVVMSTLEPEFMKELNEKVTNKGHQLIEASVSGGEIGAKEGSLTIMTAGKKDIVDQVAPHFEVMGEDFYYFGEEFGAAQKAKLANNLLLGIHIIGMAEAMQFSEKSDVPKEELLNLINASTGQSWVSENWEEVSSWTPDDTLGVLRDDLLAVVKENEQFDTSMPYGALSTQLLYDSMKKSEEP